MATHCSVLPREIVIVKVIRLDHLYQNVMKKVYLFTVGDVLINGQGGVDKTVLRYYVRKSVICYSSDIPSQ